MILSGIELIFFAEACLILSWIFDGNSGDNTAIFPSLQNSAYTDLEFSASPAALTARRLVAHKNWRGTQPTQLTQNDQRDVL